MNVCDSAKADLPHVLGVRAQHDDLVGGNARRDDQPVEVVVLDLAAEDAAERVLEDLVQRVDLHVGVGQRRLDAEVVHRRSARMPCGVMRCGCSSSTRRPMCSSIGRLSDSVIGAAEMHELEAQHAGRGLERTVQAHRRAARLRVRRAIISMSGTAARAGNSSR